MFTFPNKDVLDNYETRSIADIIFVLTVESAANGYEEVVLGDSGVRTDSLMLLLTERDVPRFKKDVLKFLKDVEEAEMTSTGVYKEFFEHCIKNFKDNGLEFPNSKIYNGKLLIGNEL